jgi:hypothetical protein
MIYYENTSKEFQTYTDVGICFSSLIIIPIRLFLFHDFTKYLNKLDHFCPQLLFLVVQDLNWHLFISQVSFDLQWPKVDYMQMVVQIFMSN